MADPLSISASVVALITIAGQLGAGLDRFLTNVKEAPAFIRDIHSELASFRVVLSGLQQLLEPSNFPVDRGALINIEDIVTAFTSAVLFFSELESALSSLNTLSGKQIELVTRVRWAIKKTRLLELLGRLQWHKLTLTLLLTALKCPFAKQAEDEQRQFHSSVKRRLNMDKDLERRLKRVESALQQLEVATPFSVTSFHPNHDDEGSESRSIRRFASDAVILEHDGHEFEHALSESWVYRRNKHRDEDLSFRTSICRQSAWTTISDLTLANVSILSVIALPIDRQELPIFFKGSTSNKVLGKPYESLHRIITEEQMQGLYQRIVDQIDSGSTRELMRTEESMRDQTRLDSMRKTRAEQASLQFLKEGLQTVEQALHKCKKSLQKRTDDLQKKKSGIEQDAVLKKAHVLLEQVNDMVNDKDAIMKDIDIMLKQANALGEEKHEITWMNEKMVLQNKFFVTWEEIDATLKVMDISPNTGDGDEDSA